MKKPAAATLVPDAQVRGQEEGILGDNLIPGLPPPALDGLRAVAVLMVFDNHYLDAFPALR